MKYPVGSIGNTTDFAKYKSTQVRDRAKTKAALKEYVRDIEALGIEGINWTIIGFSINCLGIIEDAQGNLEEVDGCNCLQSEKITNMARRIYDSDSGIKKQPETKASDGSLSAVDKAQVDFY